MSIQSKCFECGCEITKAKRVYKNRKFCDNCYARVFKRKLCPSCKNYARLYIKEPDAICKSCELAKPCIRCGRENRPVGALTEYGLVCNSCRPLFTLPKPCGICGTPSKLLSRSKRLKIDVPICPRCHRKDKSTCPSCGRHRLLQLAADGKLKCRQCAKIGEIHCPICNKNMPAGKGDKCDDCYWMKSFKKRLKIDLAAFQSSYMTDTFSDFGNWLHQEVGPKRASLLIHKFLLFFLDVERIWGELPPYKLLLEAYGAEGLRRVRLPMRWITTTQGIEVDVAMREEHSEETRIQNLLKPFSKGTVGNKLLSGYLTQLEKKLADGKTSIRSIRLALSPAARFIASTNESGLFEPTQKELNSFMAKAPGQKAAITGFVNFVNGSRSYPLAINVHKSKAKEARRTKIEKKLMSLIGVPKMTEEQELEWLTYSLELYHGIRANKTQVSKSVFNHPLGYDVEINGKKYFVPMND